MAAGATLSKSSDIAGTLRFAFRVAAMLFSLIACVPLHYLWRLVRAPSPWPMLFLRSIGWIAGVRRRVTGRPLRRNVFFVSNHLSWLDIPVLAGTNGTAFVAKDDLQRVPLIGWLCSLNKTVFVARGERMGVAEQIATLRDALAETWAITIFPEGTTGEGNGLLPFKASLLAVLDPAPEGVMVQPVLIDYGAAMPDLTWIGDEPGQDNARRVLSRRGSFLTTIRFLEPFDPADYPGRKAISAEARARMERALAA